MGLQRYQILQDLAQQIDVFEDAQERKINEGLEAGKRRDEISSRPGSEHLEEAILDGAGISEERLEQKIEHRMSGDSRTSDDQSDDQTSFDAMFETTELDGDDNHIIWPKNLP